MRLPCTRNKIYRLAVLNTNKGYNVYRSIMYCDYLMVSLFSVFSFPQHFIMVAMGHLW